MSEFTKGKWICYLPSENDIRESIEDCNIFSVRNFLNVKKNSSVSYKIALVNY